MIFRLKIILPLLGILIGIFAFSYFFKGHLFKMALEYGVSHDRFRLRFDDWDIQFGNQIEFKNKGRLEDPKGGTALVSWDNLSLIAATSPMGLGAFDIQTLNIENIQVDRFLTQEENIQNITENKEQQEAKDSTSSGNSDASKSGDGGLLDGGFDITKVDERELLERLTGQRELASEQAIEDLKNNSKKIQDKWKNKVKEIQGKTESLKQESKQLEQQYKNPHQFSELKHKFKNLNQEVRSLASLSSDQIKNPIQFAQNIQKAIELKHKVRAHLQELHGIQNKFKEDLNNIKTYSNHAQQFRNLDQDLKNDLQGLKSDIKAVEVAGKKDAEMLKEELSFKNFDAGKITRLLFGKTWEEKVRYYVGLWEKFKTYLPEPVEVQKQDQVSKIDNRPVEYDRNPELALWAIRNVNLSGTLYNFFQEGPATLSGGLSNLSSHEERLGKAASWDISGDMGKDLGLFKVLGTYSKINNSAQSRFMNFSLQGREIKEKSWGPPKVRLHIHKAQLALYANIDLASAPNLIINGNAQFSHLNFSVANSVHKDIQSSLHSAAQKALSSPIQFKIIHQPGREPRISFHSKFDDLFKGFLKDVADQKLTEKKGQLEKLFHQKLQDKLSSTLGDQGDVGKLLQNESLSLVQNANLVDGLSSLLQKTILGRENESHALWKEGDLFNQQLDTLTNKNKGLQQQLQNRINAEKEKAKKEAQKKLDEVLKGKKDPKDALDDLKKDPKEKLNEIKDLLPF